MGFMVTSRVWQEARLTRRIPCISDGVISMTCLEKRLKRKLHLSDLSNCEKNQPMLRVMRREQARPETKNSFASLLRGMSPPIVVPDCVKNRIQNALKRCARDDCGSIDRSATLNLDKFLGPWAWGDVPRDHAQELLLEWLTSPEMGLTVKMEVEGPVLEVSWQV